MKNKFFFSILAVALITIVVSFSSCKEKTGDLKVEVVNALSEPLEGKTVYLYGTESDLNANSYIEKSVTDSDGSTTFYDLEPQTYFVDVEYEFLGVEYYSSTSGTVEEGLITTVILQP